MISVIWSHIVKDMLALINRSFKRIVNIAVIVLVVLVGLSFALLNSETVSFNYYLGKIDLQLSLLLVITLVIGSIMGVLGSLGIIMRNKHEISKARREIKSKARELNTLRSVSHEDES